MLYVTLCYFTLFGCGIVFLFPCSFRASYGLTKDSNNYTNPGERINAFIRTVL